MVEGCWYKSKGEYQHGRKLVSTWYVGAVVGFAVGTLNGNSTTAIIGLFIGATVSWIFKKCLMSKK